MAVAEAAAVATNMVRRHPPADERSPATAGPTA